jgi:hypothetical protein
MPLLLFESNESLKVSSFQAQTETVQITMYNNLHEAEYSQLDINLSMDEVNELCSWLDKQRYAYEDMRKSLSDK